MLHSCYPCIVLMFVVQFEFKFFEFEFKLNLFEGFCKRKEKENPKPLFSAQTSSPAQSALFFSPSARGPRCPGPFRVPAQPRSPSALPSSPADRWGLPVGVFFPDGKDRDSPRVREEHASPRRLGVARTLRPILPAYKRRPHPPWNPIDRKPPPLACANPSRHCCQARSSAPRRRFAAQPRRLRRSEGSPRGEDCPSPRNPSLSRVLGLGKGHRSLSSAGCRCAPCSGRLDHLPSTLCCL